MSQGIDLHLLIIFLQLKTASGKNGVSGPNAQQLAISVQKWELERAVNQRLEAMEHAQGRLQKPQIASCLNVHPPNLKVRSNTDQKKILTYVFVVMFLV